MRDAAFLAQEEQCALYFESLRMADEKVFYHCDQILRGMYSTYLEIWFRYFPRDAFLILKSEEYFSDPRGTIRRVLGFLGLPDPKDEGEWEKMEAAGPVVSNVAGQAAMPAATRAELLEFYRPYNEALARMLGDPSILKWNE